METRVRGEREDRFTGAIESKTSKLPSTAYLAFAIGSMAGSAVLKILGKDEWSLFVGQWAPAFLIMGVYNKLVKQMGSDAWTRAA
jgi:inactivated superfamily I helicase